MKSKMRVSAYHLTLESNPSSPARKKNSNQLSNTASPNHQKYMPLDNTNRNSDIQRANGGQSQMASKMSQMSSTMRNKSSTPYADLVS